MELEVTGMMKVGIRRAKPECFTKNLMSSTPGCQVIWAPRHHLEVAFYK
jgi:hypothetical protein